MVDLSNEVVEILAKRMFIEYKEDDGISFDDAEKIWAKLRKQSPQHYRISHFMDMAIRSLNAITSLGWELKGDICQSQKS